METPKKETMIDKLMPVVLMVVSTGVWLQIKGHYNIADEVHYGIWGGIAIVLVFSLVLAVVVGFAWGLIERHIGVAKLQTIGTVATVGFGLFVLARIVLNHAGQAIIIIISYLY